MILTKTGIQATPTNFTQAEQGLLEQVQGDAIFWSGRAATALYHAYQLAKQRSPDVESPEIIMPAMMCATASNTAHLSNVQPRFADIDTHTGLITLETIQARYTPNTIAVVVIHLLGNLVDIEPIAAWCKDKNLLLIEDPTQALGAQFSDGHYAGSRGDVAVYSFNRTKIIHAGNGVLVSNNSEATKALSEIASNSFPFNAPTNSEKLALAISYRNLHHSLVGLLRMKNLSIQQVSEAFMKVRSAYEPLYLRPVDTDIDLNRAWGNLPIALSHRLKLANIYAERLNNQSGWQLLTGFRDSGVCWRFSLLLDNPDQQVAFSEAVRQDGFHVSNLYWAVNHFFKPDDICDGADYFSRRIVNLWVDESVSEDYVEHCCDSLLKHATQML